MKSIILLIVLFKITFIVYTQDVYIDVVTNGGGTEKVEKAKMCDTQCTLLDPYVAKSANYTAVHDDHFIAVTNGAANDTILLPTAVGVTGKNYIIKKVDAGGGDTVIDGDGAETMDGSATIDLTDQWDTLKIVSNGADWLIKYIN